MTPASSSESQGRASTYAISRPSSSELTPSQISGQRPRRQVHLEPGSCEPKPAIQMITCAHQAAPKPEHGGQRSADQ